LTGDHVQEFFKRIACVSYQMLVKEQSNSSNTSPEKIITKTQLAVNLRPTNSKKNLIIRISFSFQFLFSRLYF